jgi:hypothetical protein
MLTLRPEEPHRHYHSRVSELALCFCHGTECV